MISAVICLSLHVFMHCFGWFLLQAMFLNLQVFAFKGQNIKLTVRMLFTCIVRCDATSTKFLTFPATGVFALANLFKIIRKIMSITYDTYLERREIFPKSMELTAREPSREVPGRCETAIRPTGDR